MIPCSGISCADRLGLSSKWVCNVWTAERGGFAIALIAKASFQLTRTYQEIKSAQPRNIGLMNYWLDLFTGTTWDEVQNPGARASGFRSRMLRAVDRIQRRNSGTVTTIPELPGPSLMWDISESSGIVVTVPEISAHE
jgi:hypothetical protein